MMGASLEAATTTATTARATGVVEEEKESSGITIEVLQQHFHQPLMAVADELGVSLTMIKRLCRKLGMPRWPFRQIDSINKAMEDLHDQLEGARTEADRARYCKALEDAEKKKQLITRGAAAGVDPNVRNALYLADTANVSEDDIFGNPELMSKLSDALKTITKRKRVKGKPLVDLIATVQRDGSLPACVQGSTPVSASVEASRARARANGEGFSHDALLDSPASSCATLVAGSSPGPGEGPFSPGGGSLSGRYSPAAAGGGSGVNGTAAAATRATGVVLQQPPSFAFRPSGAAGTPSGGGAGYPHGMGQRQPSPAGGHRPRPKERLSITSSVASTDIESLDTSHLLEFDDDDDDEAVPYGGPGYAAPAGDLGCVPSAAGGVGSGPGAAGAAGGAGNRVSPEDLQELEEALLMDNFSGLMDGILEGEEIPSGVPKMEGLENMNFSGLFNSGAQPLTRTGGHAANSGPGIGAGVPRGTPRSAGAAGSPRVQMFGGRSVPSPNHAAGSASPVGTRKGYSPPPQTPGTPGTQATAPGGGSGSGSGRRRGDEAFPAEQYALPSPKDPLGSNGLMGGPSPKSRRVGARGFPERFPGSPQAGLSPHVGFLPQSPLSGGGAAAGANGSAGFNVTCSPLGGSDRTYFPAPAASAKAAALADPSSGRGHRRSSSSGLSSGWGSGHRHGGVGESGFDPCATAPSGPSAAAVAAAAACSSGAMSAGFQASATAASSSGQNWSVRLGDGTKQNGVATAPKPAPRQHGWVLSSGEVQQQQQQQQGTKSRSSSPSISANGPPQQRLPQQQSAASRPKTHGVVRRRHSAPIPPVQIFPVASGAGEFAGEDIMDMSSAACSSAIKMEFQAGAGSRQPLEGIGGGSGGGGDVLESFSTNYFGAATGAGAAAAAAAAGKWRGGAPAPAATKMGEAEGVWWQHRQAGEGGMLLETSATAARAPSTEMPGNCEFETTFDDSAGCDDLMDAHVMTATLPVDL
ncbi:Putative NIN-like transcription factor [Ectocarpus siliculosus]|uniref:NIN-like transcription factor n=1 Tax=Ectocarpus siliculosus TaxID=2880 RepID=D8LTZ5_ECTSI|nr:Putative NIN-like transcription factor [Ectocarpus siliculosus]|eukprot:CBN75385.1 Putative NIN-like transcription factor [Ectocarpus siliculosus]